MLNASEVDRYSGSNKLILNKVIGINRFIELLKGP